MIERGWQNLDSLLRQQIRRWEHSSCRRHSQYRLALVPPRNAPLLGVEEAVRSC